MALSKKAAKDLAQQLKEVRSEHIGSLDLLYKYRRGHQLHPIPETGIPEEVRRFIRMSRVNVVKLVVQVLTQSLFVDGFRADTPESEGESEAWEVWQRNRLDARQTSVHRAVFTYGGAYVTVLPGDPLPVITPKSPRRMTVVYGEDPDWPYAALEVSENGEHQTYELWDEANIYRFTTEGGFEYVSEESHDAGRVPIVRFVNEEDLDNPLEGEVEQLIPLQDQIDVITFGLMVTQHYQAFIQRYIIGWTPENQAEKFMAMASRLWHFDDDVKVGQFNQADLGGYIKSREDTLQLLAIASQTPPHHLLGQMVNLSAEALAAAESGHRRKINERETTLGESWEQVLNLASVLRGQEPDLEAEVRWRDTEARSLAQTVDALGKLAQMLGVPPEELWERVPGVTQQDIRRWKAAAKEADVLGQFAAILDRNTE